jgi:hypothetical protein
MATEKKSTPGFAGQRPAAIDHLNPPKPAKPAAEEKRAADHFTRQRPGAIDPTAKPAAAPAVTTAKPADKK